MDVVDEPTLLELGFERYEDVDWKPDGWLRETDCGAIEYVLCSWPGREEHWELRIWSGLGNGESYGYTVESPTERQLRLVVQALTEDEYEPETPDSTSWTEVGPYGKGPSSEYLSLEELKTMRGILVEEIQQRQ